MASSNNNNNNKWTFNWGRALLAESTPSPCIQCIWVADTIKMAMPLRLDAIFVVGAALHTTTFVWDSTLRLVKALGAFISLRETTSIIYLTCPLFQSRWTGSTPPCIWNMQRRGGYHLNGCSTSSLLGISFLFFFSSWLTPLCISGLQRVGMSQSIILTVAPLLVFSCNPHFCFATYQRKERKGNNGLYFCFIWKKNLMC